MESKVEYRVLAPDSVAWHIQAALVADRSGNEAARDLALCEAARVAAERRLVEPMKRYDCRTTGQRIDAIEAGLPPQIQVEARRMRARMRYVADVLRSARRMLDTPTVDEVDGLLLHAIGLLRMADGKDGADGADEAAVLRLPHNEGSHRRAGGALADPQRHNAQDRGGDRPAAECAGGG